MRSVIWYYFFPFWFPCSHPAYPTHFLPCSGIHSARSPICEMSNIDFFSCARIDASACQFHVRSTSPPPFSHRGIYNDILDCPSLRINTAAAIRHKQTPPPSIFHPYCLATIKACCHTRDLDFLFHHLPSTIDAPSCRHWYVYVHTNICANDLRVQSSVCVYGVQ